MIQVISQQGETSSHQINEDKQMLVLSMAKLLENNEHQEEIFYSFLEDDLQKLLQNMEDSNIKLRKVSARFLCELLHNCAGNQERFCQLLNLNLISGGVCINQIPSTFISVLSQNPTIMEKIQRKSQFIQENMRQFNNGEVPLCWYVTLQQLYTLDVEPQFLYKKYNQPIEDLINDFLDPETAIFGISISSSLYPPIGSSRNSVCTNQLIEENIVNEIAPLPQSHSTKNMSNLNKSSDVNPFKRTETHEKSPIKYSSPHHFKKQYESGLMMQTRSNKDQGLYDQKRNSIGEFGLQNEYVSVSQSLNFKGDNNIGSYNNFRSSLSPNHSHNYQNNVSVNTSQLSYLNNQSTQINKISKKNGYGSHADRNTPFYDYNFVPHQEINLLDGNENLNSNRNRGQQHSQSQQQDLSSSLLSPNQLLSLQNRPFSQMANTNHVQSNGLDMILQSNSYRESNFQSQNNDNPIFQQSLNHRISQMTNETQSQQPESMFQSILTQQEGAISHQASVYSNKKGGEQSSQLTSNGLSTTTKQSFGGSQGLMQSANEANQSASRGNSPVFKYSSAKINKYFLSPEQRNTNTKTVNYNLNSKENHQDQKTHSNSTSNGVPSYNGYSSQNGYHFHQHHTSAHYNSSMNNNKTQPKGIHGNSSFSGQNVSTLMSKQLNNNNTQQNNQQVQKQVDPSSFLVSSQNGIISNNNNNINEQINNNTNQQQNNNFNGLSYHTHSKSNKHETGLQNRGASSSKQTSLVSYKQLSNNASCNDSAYLKTFAAYNSSIQGSFLKDNNTNNNNNNNNNGNNNINEVIQKIETINIDKNDYQILQEVDVVKQQMPNLSQFRTSLDSQINIYSSSMSSTQNNNDHRLSLQKGQMHMKPRRISNGQTSIQLELTDLDYNQSKNTSKFIESRGIQQKNEIASSNDISSPQINKNLLQASQSTRATTNSSSNFQLNLHRGTTSNGIASNGNETSNKVSQSQQFKSLGSNLQNQQVQQSQHLHLSQKANTQGAQHNSKGSASTLSNQVDKKKIQNSGLVTSQDHLSLKKISQSISSASPKLNLIISPRNIPSTSSSSVKENQAQNEIKQPQQQQSSTITNSQNIQSLYSSQNNNQKSATNSSNNPEILQSRKSHDLWMMNYIIQTSKRKNSYDVSKTGAQPINNLAYQSKNMQSQNGNNNYNNNMNLNTDKQQNKVLNVNKQQQSDSKTGESSSYNTAITLKTEQSKKNPLMNQQTNEKTLQISTQMRAVSPQSNILTTSQTSKYHHKSFTKDDFKSPQQSIRKKMII